jgi:hypothetical protein
MKPTIELLELAKQKSLTLGRNQQIRLTADNVSYELFNIEGTIFIGYDTKDVGIGNFFAKKETYTINDCGYQYKVQKLFSNKNK